MSGTTTCTIIAICCMLTFLNGANASHSEIIGQGGQYFKSALDSTTSDRPEFSPYYGHFVTCKHHPSDKKANFCCARLAECNEVIPPASTKYGIYNPNNVNLNGCACDIEFLDCLQKAAEKSDSNLYEQIGRTYFDLEPRKCFLSLYNPICHGSFYDRAGNEHDENSTGRYFCPVVRYNKKYHEIWLAP